MGSDEAAVPTDPTTGTSDILRRYVNRVGIVVTGVEGLRSKSLSRGALWAALLSLAGCGGGGGGGDGGNRSPTASLAITPACGQAPLVINLDATASSDPDGSIATYSWTFGDGGSASGATTSHTYASAGTFEVRLTVTDDRGATASATRSVTAIAGPPPANVNVAGVVTFDRVPFLSLPGDGLDYPGTFQAPAREVEVELIRVSNQAVLATTSTAANGSYLFTAPLNTDVFVRAKALSRFPGSPSRPSSWDIRILNNTNSNALYVLSGDSFNTCVVNQTRNLRATTGWSGGFAGTYTGTRAAAPFAVLDTLYSAVQFVISNDGGDAVQFPALSAFWSTQNKPSSNWNPGNGDIETTLYQPTARDGFQPGIYVLGMANNDTDEFDQHVLAHEFQHYLEDAVSRTDTVGGDHSLSENLDMRVAFSEGFSNAFSAMVLTGLVDDPEVYRDSLGSAQGSDGWFDMESEEWGTPGWYNEASVHRIAWDLFDTSNDLVDGDSVSVGFGPMLDVMRTQLRNDTPLTSLFSFVTALKLHPSVVPVAANVTSRVQAESNIVATTMDAYATTETNAGAVDDAIVLPVYSSMSLNGPTVRRCADVTEGSYNKLGNRRYVRFNVPSARTITVRVECPSSDSSCGSTPTPDPDLILSRGPSLWFGDSANARVEEIDANVTAGDYVLEFYEYSHTLPEGSTQRGRTCMTVSITGN